MSESEIDLGECCACRQAGPTVRNVIMLGFRAPVPGTGWGCAVCHLGADGALAVVCDRCLESGRQIVEVCDGYPMEKKRKPRSAFMLPGLKLSPREPFAHDMSQHPEEERC